MRRLVVLGALLLTMAVEPTVAAAVGEFWLDTRSTGDFAVSQSSENLAADTPYVVTVQGTFSFWAASNWTATLCQGKSPENAPMFLSDGFAPASQTKVGADPAFIFAAPSTSSSICNGTELPYSHSRLEISLNNGSSWTSLPTIDKYNSQHAYRYLVVGQGAPFQMKVRLFDRSTSDNYGKFKITVEVQPTVVWLPPVSLTDWSLNENATLPIKFQLTSGGQVLQSAVAGVTLKINDVSYTPVFDPATFAYQVNFRPEGIGKRTAEVWVSGIEYDEITFDVVDPPAANGKGKKSE